MIGIYKITNPNNRIYIGQSTNIEARWEKYKKDSDNKNFVLYDLVIKQNGKDQAVAIRAPFDCKVIKAWGGADSGVALIGTGSAKGKTAVFLHVVPSKYNTSRAKKLDEKAKNLLIQETEGKSFKKGSLITYQGNWGKDSTDVHLHVQNMTKEDFDQYVTDLPTFYPKAVSNPPVGTVTSFTVT